MYLKGKCVNMINITKEEILKNGDSPKWRVKKPKIVTIGLVLFILFCIVNAVLVYNFYRILSMF